MSLKSKGLTIGLFLYVPTVSRRNQVLKLVALSCWPPRSNVPIMQDKVREILFIHENLLSTSGYSLY